MFKELFTESTDLFVASMQLKRGGLDMMDFDTGEVIVFKNMKDLHTKVSKDPLKYKKFFRKTSRILRDEAKKAGNHYYDALEPVLITVDKDVAKKIL